MAQTKVFHTDLKSTVAFRAYQNGASGATASIVANVPTKINFTTANYNIGNFYNPSLSRAIAPAKGLYFFHAYAQLLAASPHDVGAYFYINGIQQNRTYNGLYQYPELMGTEVFLLNAGDYVEFYGLDRSATTSMENNSQTNAFMGYLIGLVD